MTDLVERHPSVQAAIDRLRVNPNLPTDVQGIAQRYYDLGVWLAENLPDDPDLTDALRKLWESKNSSVYLAVMYRRP